MIFWVELLLPRLHELVFEHLHLLNDACGLSRSHTLQINKVGLKAILSYRRFLNQSLILVVQDVQCPISFAIPKERV